MPRTILALGAHADDIELGIGGTLARHSSNGDHVFAIVVTDSAYEANDGTLVRSSDTAQQELYSASTILGIEQVDMWRYRTKFVKFGAELIEDIDRAIIRIKPDIIYTHWDGDIHQDHSAIARATITAGRRANRILMYRSNWYKSNEHFDGNLYVDISKFIDIKEAAIRAHKSEVSRRGDCWIDYFRNQNRNAGLEVGVEYAETFQVVKWLMS